MQSFLNKFKHSSSSSSSNSHNSLAATAEDKKNNQLKTNNDNKPNAKSSSPTNVNTKKSSINSNSSLSKIISTASNVSSKQHASVFSIVTQSHAKDKLNSKKSSSPKQTKNNSLKKNELNVFSLIIDSAPLATDSTRTSDENNNNVQIFDPELAPEETHTCNQSTVSKKSVLNVKKVDVLENLDLKYFIIFYYIKCMYLLILSWTGQVREEASL